MCTLTLRSLQECRRDQLGGGGGSSKYNSYVLQLHCWKKRSKILTLLKLVDSTQIAQWNHLELSNKFVNGYLITMAAFSKLKNYCKWISKATKALYEYTTYTSLNSGKQLSSVCSKYIPWGLSFTNILILVVIPKKWWDKELDKAI